MITRHIIPGGTKNPRLLAGIHCLRRIAFVFIAAVFDLDKNQVVSISCDNINLTSITGNEIDLPLATAEIPAENLITVPGEIFTRQSFIFSSDGTAVE